MIQRDKVLSPKLSDLYVMDGKFEIKNRSIWVREFTLCMDFQNSNGR
jgi:hypothetical protein